MSNREANIIDDGHKPYIEGHRITVQFVAEYHNTTGDSPEQIAKEFRLTLAEVYAALSYYHNHKEEIDRAIAEDAAIAEGVPSIQDVLDEPLKMVATPQEIADDFPITVSAVYQAIRRKRLRARKSGDTWLVLRRDAEALWGNRATRP